jgi:hypothetical protein
MSSPQLILSDENIRFIADQKMFFVATATADSRVNLSPKGMSSFRVLGEDRVAWLNVTGSGNETAAHVSVLPRMTLMFCAFEGEPQILRLYGTARAVHRADPDWEALLRHFEPLPGTRQIFDVHVELVQVSCGMAVPLYDYSGERDALLQWATKKGDAGLAQYWRDKNQVSLDGVETGILHRSGLTE